MIGTSLTGLRAQPFIPVIEQKDKFDNRQLEAFSEGYIGTLDLIGSDEGVGDFASGEASSFLNPSSPEEIKTCIESIIKQARLQTEAKDVTFSLPKLSRAEANDKAKQALQLLDDIMSFLQKQDLSSSEECYKAAPFFSQSLFELEDSLHKVKTHYQDTSLFQEISEKIDQADCLCLIEKLAQVETDFKPLARVREDIKVIIKHLKSQLPSETKNRVIRGAAVALTVLGIVLSAYFSIKAAPLTILVILGTYGWENRNSLINQNIEKWESFTESLKNLKQHSPITENKMFSALSSLASQTANLSAKMDQQHAELRKLLIERTNPTTQAESAPEVAQEANHQPQVKEEAANASQADNKKANVYPLRKVA